MIVIRVELHSAITREVTEIARMHISNIARTYRGRSIKQLSRCKVQRQRTIKKYPRLKMHVWHLLRALIVMKYGGAARARATDRAIRRYQRATPGEGMP
jgi:hypothetical protein